MVRRPVRGSEQSCYAPAMDVPEPAQPERRTSLRVSALLPFRWLRCDDRWDRPRLHRALGVHGDPDLCDAAREAVAALTNPEVERVLSILVARLDQLEQRLQLIEGIPQPTALLSLCAEGLAFRDAEGLSRGDRLGFRVDLPSGTLIDFGRVVHHSPPWTGVELEHPESAGAKRLARTVFELSSLSQKKPRA